MKPQRRLRLRKIVRAKKKPLTPSVHRPSYTPSDLRAALRRVQQRRAEAAAQGGYHPLLARHVAEIRRACLSNGWLKPARKKAMVTICLKPKLVEEGLWLTGLARIDELVKYVLADIVLSLRHRR